MLESEFISLANQELQDILQKLEEQNQNDIFEIDMLDGILYIKLNNSSVYVINKHRPTKQIWLSSPISGGSHFSYGANIGQWVSSKGLNLRDTLSQELGVLI